MFLNQLRVAHQLIKPRLPRSAHNRSDQRRAFTVHFDKAPALEWKIPLTYEVPGEPAAASVLMTSKTMELPGVSGEHGIKLNVEGAGNYRVQYDDASWKLLLTDLPKLSVPDRVNLMTDAWAMVQANRAAEQVPELKPYLDTYVEAPGNDAKKFAAVYLMLKYPGTRPYVDEGIGRPTPLHQIDNYRNNWWCAL